MCNLAVRLQVPLSVICVGGLIHYCKLYKNIVSEIVIGSKTEKKELKPDIET